MKIIVTGASGRLGQQIVSALQNNISDNDSILTAGRLHSDLYYSLEQGFDEKNIDILRNSRIIHTAFDWSDLHPNGNINILGLTKLISQSRDIGFELTLVSTFSANCGSSSWYAQTKTLQESIFKKSGAVHIMKFGIILDRKSHLSSRFLHFFAQFPIIVIPKTSMHFVFSSINDEIEKWILGDKIMTEQVSANKNLTFREVLLQSRLTRHNFEPLFLEIDFACLVPLLRTLRRRIKGIGVICDSLIFIFEHR